MPPCRAPVRPSSLKGGKSVIEVTLGENDRLDWALKQFRRKLIRSGLLKEIKKKRFYEKPSEAKKRRLKREKAKAC